MLMKIEMCSVGFQVFGDLRSGKVSGRVCDNREKLFSIFWLESTEHMPFGIGKSLKPD